MSKSPKVLLKWNGNTSTKCRLENGGEKVVIKPGSCRFATIKKAKNLQSTYKEFRAIGLDEATEKEIKDARRFEEAKVDDKQAEVEKGEKTAPETEDNKKDSPSVGKEANALKKNPEAPKGKN